MLYQKMLGGKTPYHLALNSLSEFEKHSHLECEIIYCVSGSGKIIIGNKLYEVNAGEVAFISSMLSHEFPKESTDFYALVLEIGPTLLKSAFKGFSALSLSSPLIKIENNEPLKQAFDELVMLQKSEKKSELLTLSAIYKICGLLYERLSDDSVAVSDTAPVSSVEKALQIIYSEYNTDLTVDYASRVTGYGKSNFCKIFKATYGDTFHHILNKHRIENACYLLSETDLSVAEIAESVGFIDLKTFYRVFKKITGRTPCEHRKGN